MAEDSREGWGSRRGAGRAPTRAQVSHRSSAGDGRSRVSGVPPCGGLPAPWPGCPCDALHPLGPAVAGWRVHLSVGRVLPVDLEHEGAALRGGQRGHGGRAGGGRLGWAVAGGGNPGRRRAAAAHARRAAASSVSAGCRLPPFHLLHRDDPGGGPSLRAAGRSGLGGRGRTAGLPSGGRYRPGSALAPGGKECGRVTGRPLSGARARGRGAPVPPAVSRSCQVGKPTQELSTLDIIIIVIIIIYYYYYFLF